MLYIIIYKHLNQWNVAQFPGGSFTKDRDVAERRMQQIKEQYGFEVVKIASVTILD